MLYAFPDPDVTWKRNSTTSPVNERRPPNNLLARIVTVSLETMTIIDTLPPLNVLAHQQKE